MSKYQGTKLELTFADNQYAVYTAEPISAGSIIEHCVTLTQNIDDVSTSNFTFNINGNKVLALGYGSYYRQSSHPNAEVRQSKNKAFIELYALKNIAAGEEITIRPRMIFYRGKITIADSKISRYGIISEQQFDVGALIEECPIIALDNQNNFEHYLFGYDKNRFCMPLGFGCLYNHSDNPNAEYSLSYNGLHFLFHAKRLIKPGDEITINYGPDYWSGRKIKKHT